MLSRIGEEERKMRSQFFRLSVLYNTLINVTTPKLKSGWWRLRIGGGDMGGNECLTKRGKNTSCKNSGPL